ncbi:MAG: 3-keto-disaccharide hydrolase, partial [Flavobacteriaceae bacterium]
YMTGPEIQILDNDRHPDALSNPKFHQAGALYDLVQPTAEVCKPAGEWNHVILSIDHAHNSGYVVLNGTEIVRFPLQGKMWRKKVKNSKFKGWKGFGKFKTGKIGLQDHGDKVAFRKIKIKKL